jgi:hypothetical protein
MSQEQTTGLMEFSNMCISAGTMDISNTFQCPQWNFPTLSNMNIGIFQEISLHIGEFSNILKQIMRNRSKMNIGFFTHIEILQHLKHMYCSGLW